ncbi:MAG: phosphatase PAP2 family protein [Steroidobacteraceae bacterium]
MTVTSLRRTALISALCLLAFSAGTPAAETSHPLPAAGSTPADTAQCVDARTLDLRRILPPPPAAGSPEERAELDVLLRIEAHRTPRQTDRARRDAKLNILGFADALGARPGALTTAGLPLTLALFRHVSADEFAIVDAAKSEFGRPRPFTVEPRLHPVVAPPQSPSYPSGHSTWAYTTALVLGDMVPERRRQLLVRAGEYAYDRNVAGVHYPSDVEAGKLAGTALATLLLTCQPFESEEAAARVELRSALGLH